MPRLGLDCLFLAPGVTGGPETFLRELVPELAKAAPAGWEIEVATSRRGAAALRAAGWTSFARLIRLPMDDDERVRKLLAQQVALPRLARRRGWSVLHSLANLAPVAARVPLVVTLHDVLPLRERTMSYVSRTSIGLVIRLTAPRACVVVTIADATRDDILSTLRLDQRRVVVVHNGPGRSVGRAAEPQALARRLGLTGRRVVLNVAAKRAHKNQRLLLEAAPALPDDVVIVLVGHDDGDAPYLRGRTQALGIAGRIVHLDYVPDDELEALYALASCVALPTRGEGFGAPVLEALRRGVPVACSDLAVLHEVGGDVPAYFSPDDPRAAADAVMAVLGDRERAARARSHVAKFSWAAAARAYWEVYERCASG